MKKILALIMAVLMMTVCFAGCGEETVSSTVSEENKNTTSSAVTEEKIEFKGTTVKEGVLTMATNAYFQPYEFYEGEKIVGIDVEIAEEIAKKLGLKLEISDMAFDSIITAVSEGSADLGLAGMTVDEKRLKSVDFSVSYANGVQVVIVKEDSAIKTVDDVAGKKVGVQLGTTGDSYATGDYGEDKVTQFTTGNEAVSALLGGDVDCVIIDNEPAKAFVANNKGLKILDTTYADEDYAACIRKGNTELLNAVDKAINQLIADGTIDRIVSKYIK